MPLEGSRAGAPEATQVADRWHLRHNLTEHAAKTVARHHACLKQPAPGEAVPPGTAEQEAADHEQEPAGSAVPGEPADGPAGEGRLTARTRERYAAIHELLQAGESLHAISRVLSLSRPAVRRFARAASVDELLAEATGREPKLDPFRPYICQRWNEGLTDAAALHAASPAACGPSAATWPRSGRQPPHPIPRRRRPRPGRLPAGCSPALTTFSQKTSPGSTPSASATGTSTPWPGTLPASPR